MACISETRTLPRALQTAFDMFDMGHGSKSIEDLLTSHLALSQNWIPTPTLNSLALSTISSFFNFRKMGPSPIFETNPRFGASSTGPWL